MIGHFVAITGASVLMSAMFAIREGHYLMAATFYVSGVACVYLGAYLTGAKR